MTLRPYKFLITAIAQEIDDAGRVVREVTIGADPSGAPVTVYDVDGLHRWADEFAAALRDGVPSGE